MKKATFCVVVVIISSVDLVSAHMHLNPVVPKDFYTKKPEIAHNIGDQPFGRIFVHTPSRWHSHGRNLSPFTLQQIWRHHLWPNTGTLYNISYVNGIGGTETEYQWLITELLEKLNMAKRIRFLELTNTRYIVAMAPEKVESEMRSARLIEIQKNLFQLPHAMPRAYMVPESKVVKNRAKAIEEILGSEYDPWQTVILEERPEVSVPDGSAGKVLDVSYTGPNTIEVTAQSFGGYLVLLDSFYPGWRVLVNGQERKLFRANGLFKAVFLEQGMHHIAFTYQPRSLAWGFRISFVSLCLVLVGLWVWRPKRHVPNA